MSAIAFAEKIKTKVSEKVVFFDDHAFTTTISIGVALMNSDADETIDDIIYRADSVLCRAKNEGRDCIKVWEAADTFKPSAYRHRAALTRESA